MTKFKTLYKDYWCADITRHFGLHIAAEQWANDHSIKVRQCAPYTLDMIYEFENDEDLLVFTLQFGELII